jgi:hypothetical protein
VSAAIITVAVDTTTQRLLLVLAAVLVGASVGPPPVRPRPVPEPRPAPDPHAPSPFAAPGMGSVPALFAVDSDVVRDRHRELYDTEYVKQLERVDVLRRTIGTRLALAGESHQPSEEPDPTEELDA